MTDYELASNNKQRGPAVKNDHRGINGFPELVVRPNVIWDTRAPFFKFQQYHRKENEIYYVLLLATAKLLNDARDLEPSASAENLLVPSNAGKNTQRVWKSYMNSFPGSDDIPRSSPTIHTASGSLIQSVPAITEYAIVSYCGLFETFVQCWALNYLLAKLETGHKWTDADKKLAITFIFNSFGRKRIPGFPEICDALTIIKTELTRLPHIFTEPTTKNSVETPITPNLNAYTTIAFWRDWRNLLVHSSGLVNKAFYDKHQHFWRDFKSVYKAIPNFMLDRRLSLNEHTFRALTTVHYRAAKRLKDILVEMTKGHRGHILAPSPANAKVPPSKLPQHLPPMLLPVDHAASYKWTRDAIYRNDIKKQLSSLGV